MKNFWLFQPSAAGLSGGKKAAFWLWNGLVLLLAGLCLGGLSLFFAYGDYPDVLMKSYFQHPLIAVLRPMLKHSLLRQARFLSASSAYCII